MIKKLLLLSLVLPLFLFAKHDVALKINNENLILDGNYNFQNSNSSEYYLGTNLQIKSHEGLNQTDLVFKVLNNLNSYKLGMGLNTSWLKIKDAKNIFSIPINLYFSYSMEKLGFDLSLGYAPEILTKTSNKDVSGILNTKIEGYYNIIPNGDFLVGYKNNLIFLSGQDNKSINETTYLGIRFYF